MLSPASGHWSPLPSSQEPLPWSSASGNCQSSRDIFESVCERSEWCRPGSIYHLNGLQVRTPLPGALQPLSAWPSPPPPPAWLGAPPTWSLLSLQALLHSAVTTLIVPPTYLDLFGDLNFKALRHSCTIWSQASSPATRNVRNSLWAQTLGTRCFICLEHSSLILAVIHPPSAQRSLLQRSSVGPRHVFPRHLALLPPHVAGGLTILFILFS